MREYGSVSPQFWIGKTGKALRGKQSQQLLALYLMTCPHANMIGVFHCPVMYMSHETGMTFEEASEALRSLVETGFCLYDIEHETVFVIRMAAHQVGENLDEKDNKVKGVQREVAKIAVPSLKEAFIKEYASSYHLNIEAPSKPLPRVDSPPSKQLTGQDRNKTETGSGMDADIGFASFWSAFPNKKAKQDAYKAWSKLKPCDALQASILKAIAMQRQGEDWRKEGGRFIPYAATWLNGKRWEDSVSQDPADNPFAGVL